MDQAGGWIPGATVTLLSDDRVRTTKADSEGRFTFTGLTAPTHFLEAAYTGFLFASIPVSNQTTDPVTLALMVGTGGQCPSYAVFTYPSATYEERSSNVQLTGTVVDFSGSPLPNASLNLMKADLNAIEARWPNPYRTPSMNERSFRFMHVAQMTANERGEFQFTGLEPGWYSLIAGHDDYQEGTARFWIARENLTRTTLIHLNRKVDARGCDTIFGPMRPPIPITRQSQ